MLNIDKLLRISLLILLIDTITICINAKSLPHRGNTNGTETNLSTSIPNEPELNTLPKPIAYIHPTTRPTIGAVPYMNDIDYDLRLRQLMEELVLRSRTENQQKTAQTYLPPNLKLVQPTISSDKLPKISAVDTNPLNNANKIQQNQSSTIKDSYLDFILLEYMTNVKQNLSHFIANIKTNATSNVNSTNATDSQRIRQQLAFLQKNAEKFKKFQQVQERTKNTTQWDNVLREIDQFANFDVMKTTENSTENIDDLSNTGNHLMNDTSNKNENDVIAKPSFDNYSTNENKHKLHNPESSEGYLQQSIYKNQSIVQKLSTVDFENKNYLDSKKYNENFTNTTTHTLDKETINYVYSHDITINNNLEDTTTSFNGIETSTESPVVITNVNNIPTDHLQLTVNKMEVLTVPIENTIITNVDNYQEETSLVNSKYFDNGSDYLLTNSNMDLYETTTLSNVIVKVEKEKNNITDQYQTVEKTIDDPNIEKGTTSNTSIWKDFDPALQEPISQDTSAAIAIQSATNIDFTQEQQLPQSKFIKISVTSKSEPDEALNNPESKNIKTTVMLRLSTDFTNTTFDRNEDVPSNSNNTNSVIEASSPKEYINLAKVSSKKTEKFLTTEFPNTITGDDLSSHSEFDNQQFFKTTDLPTAIENSNPKYTESPFAQSADLGVLSFQIFDESFDKEETDLYISQTTELSTTTDVFSQKSTKEPITETTELPTKIYELTVQPIYNLLLISKENSNQIGSTTNRNTDMPTTAGIFDTTEWTTSHTSNLPAMIAASNLETTNFNMNIPTKVPVIQKPMDTINEMNIETTKYSSNATETSIYESDLFLKDSITAAITEIPQMTNEKLSYNDNSKIPDLFIDKSPSEIVFKNNWHNAPINSTSNGQKESVSEIVGLTQSSSYQKPSITIENVPLKSSIPGSLSVNYSNQPNALKEYKYITDSPTKVPVIQKPMVTTDLPTTIDEMNIDTTEYSTNATETSYYESDLFSNDSITAAITEIHPMTNEQLSYNDVSYSRSPDIFRDKAPSVSKNSPINSTSNAQTESVTEIVWLTQSSSYKKPSIIIESVPYKTSIPGPLVANFNNQPSELQKEILKPEEGLDNLAELLKIIGNSLQDSAYANKRQNHKMNKTNADIQHNDHKKQQFLVKVTSTVNCHTQTMQLSTPSSQNRTEFPYSSEAAAQSNKNIVIDKTIENHKQSNEKWSTLKNNQLNNDTLTKADNDDKMKKNVHVNANTDAVADADVYVNASDCDDDDDDNAENDKGTTIATSTEDKDIRLDEKVDVDIENEIANDNNNPNERVDIGPAAATATGQKYWTNNVFKVSPIEGGINEMSTIDNKLLDISKHSSNGMTNTIKTIASTSTTPPTSTYDKHAIVNKNSKKVFTNNGNEDENTKNYYNSSYTIEQNQHDVYEKIDNDENDDDDSNDNGQKMNDKMKEISTISDTILNSQTFPDITPYHSNSNGDDKHILSSAQTKQEITTTNWWHSLPYAEIRKFLNSILESVTSSTDLSLDRSVDTLFKTAATTTPTTTTATSKTIVKPIKERKSKEQWSSLIFNYIWSLLL